MRRDSKRSGSQALFGKQFTVSQQKSQNCRIISTCKSLECVGMQMTHMRLSGALSRRADVSSHLENVAMHVSLPELPYLYSPRRLLYSPRNANTILYGSE